MQSQAAARLTGSHERVSPDILSCMAASSSLVASPPDAAISAAALSAVPHKQPQGPAWWRNSQQRCIL